MKNWFSLNLYIEGLKKIKVPGFASAIAVIALNSILPISGIISASSRSNPSVEAVEVSSFAPFSLLMMLFSAILVYSMFSYLNERSRADFWHAIPQTRICVYISLTASIYTWILGTILSSALINLILWGIAKYSSVSLGTFLVSSAVYFLAAILIAGFMTLAMTITGTTVSNVLILALLLLFTRIIGSQLVMGIQEMVPMVDINYSVWQIFEFDFWLPYALFENLFSSSQAFVNVPLILYTIGVVVLLFALGAFCYNKRHSEMATQSAPNTWMQHIYRSAITLPLVLYFAILLITEDLEGITTVILIIGIILVWLIFELMTTKKIKKAMKSLPLLIIPVAISALLCGALFVNRSFVWNDTPDADDIKGITLGVEQYRRKSYEQLKTENLVVENDDVNRVVSEALRTTAEKAQKSDSYFIENSRHIVIHLESGRVIGRNISMSDYLYTTVQNGFYQSDLYREAQLSMPTAKEISTISFESLNIGKETTNRLWECYLQEYSLLTDSQKRMIKEQEYVVGDASLWSVSEKIDLTDLKQNRAVGNIYVNGSIKFEAYQSVYPIYYALMPKTSARYLEIYCEQCLLFSDNAKDELQALDALLREEESFESIMGGFVDFVVLYGDTELENGISLYSGSEKADLEQFEEVMALLGDLSAPNDYSYESGKTLIYFNCSLEMPGDLLEEFLNGDVQYRDDAYYYHYERIPIMLNAEEVARLKSIFDEKTSGTR